MYIMYCYISFIDKTCRETIFLSKSLISLEVHLFFVKTIFLLFPMFDFLLQVSKRIEEKANGFDQEAQESSK